MANQTKIEVGTKFKIDGKVYPGKTFVCTAITESASGAMYHCEAGDGIEYGFLQGSLDYYGDSVRVVGQTLEAAKAKVAEILASPHVARVEVALEEEFGSVRIYSAITKDKGMPHLYRVRVEDAFENGETVTTAKCNCLAGAKGANCRHLEKVAAVDAKRLKREIYPFELARYSAHRRRMAA